MVESQLDLARPGRVRSAMERVLLGAALLAVQGWAGHVRSTDEAGALVLAVFYAPILATAETFLARRRAPGLGMGVVLRAAAGMTLAAAVYFAFGALGFFFAGHWALSGLMGFLSSFAALPGIRLYEGPGLDRLPGRQRRG